jgi:transcriptional regulator with XRE-family HTH domain
MSLRIARKIARFTQRELSLRTGIDITRICHIENGDARITKYADVERVAAALHIEPDELRAFLAVPDPRWPAERAKRAAELATPQAPPRRRRRPAAVGSDHA